MSLFQAGELIAQIERTLTLLSERMKTFTGLGHNTDAKLLEPFAARLLNRLYGWNLTDPSEGDPTYQGLDLEDRGQRVAIQVSVQEPSGKIRHTISKLTDEHRAAFDDIRCFFLHHLPPPKDAALPIINIRTLLEQLMNRSLEELRDYVSFLDEELTGLPGGAPEPGIRHTRQNLRYASLGPLFVGRADTMLAIRAGLTSGHATAIRGHALHGMGGVGKTRAAVEYAWQFLASYTHILMVNADSPDALDTSLAGLCRKKLLNLPEKSSTDQNAQRDAVLEWLESHRDWLLILDNADSPASLAAVKDLLPALSAGHVLLTTRLTDVPPQFTSLPLDVLSAEAAAAYLLTGTDGPRAAVPDDAARAAELAGLLGHLALALEQAAACIRVTGRSFADYIAHWQSHTAEALDWYVEGKMDYPLSLARTWQSSVDQLTPGAKFLLQQFSWCAPDPIPLKLPEVEVFTAEQRVLIAELTNLSLAKKSEDGSAFSVHRLVQEITRQQQSGPGDTPVRGAAALDCGDLSPLSESGLVRASPNRPASDSGSETETARAQASASPGTSPLTQKLEQVPALQSGSAAPPALTAALSWLNALVPFETDDVRTWPVIAPLAPHVRAAALCAAERAIPQPTARLLNQVAIFYNTKAQHQTAEPLMRRAMAIDEESYGPAHPNVAIRLGNLAGLLMATNRLAEAETLMRRALSIGEKSYGPAHPEVAIHLNNLAGLLKDTNRLAGAEPLIRRALAIDEESYGPSHPNVASDLNNLAQLLKDTNRLAEAEPLMRRALAIAEESYGPAHPNVAIGLNNLALLLQDTNRLAEAEPLMRRALSIDEESFGPSHPKVAIRLNNLALLLQDTNRLAEAEPLMRRALSIDEESYGPSHPRVATDLNNLAQLLQNANRLTEAEPLMRRALAIDEESFGPSHPDVATDLNNLGQLLKATNRLAEAEPLMRRHLEIFVNFTAQTEHQHPHLQNAINNYAGLLFKIGETEEKIREKIRKILEPILK